MRPAVVGSNGLKIYFQSDPPDYIFGLSHQNKIHFVTYNIYISEKQLK